MLQLQNKQLGLVQSDWEIQEGELQLLALSAKLNARELKVINFFLEGHPLIECATLAGCTLSDMTLLSRFTKQVLDKPEAQQYIEVAKRVYTQRAMQQVCYDKMQWMQDMQSVLGKALGREKTNVVSFTDGAAFEHKVHKDDLPAAQRALEMIGKTFGWLTEKKELTVEHKAVVRVRDFSGKGKHFDVSSQSSSDEVLLEQINDELAANMEMAYEVEPDPEKTYVELDPPAQPGDEVPPEWDRPLDVYTQPPRVYPNGKPHPARVRIVMPTDADHANRTGAEDWE